MDRAITDEEMKTAIQEIFHDAELVGNIGGGMTEVAATRFETEAASLLIPGWPCAIG